MSLVDAKGLFFPEPMAQSTYVSTLLDAAGERAASMFQAPKTGTIDRLCFRTATVTTSQSMRVRLETVGSDGNPTGTLVGTNTEGTQASVASNTWYEVTLTAGASVTRGQALALVIDFTSTAGTLNIARVATPITVSIPYQSHYTTIWTKASGGMIHAVRYSDATYPYIHGFFPYATLGANSINSLSAPNERGNLFTMPFDAVATGIWFGSTNTNGPYVATLYDTSNNVLAQGTVGDQFTSNGANTIHTAIFDSEYTLAAGTQYRVAMRATSSTNAVSIRNVTWQSAVGAALPGGTTFQRTTRSYSTGSEAWTETANARESLGLILTQVDDGAGSGGGTTVVASSYGFSG